jgi:hypothetical protein
MREALLAAALLAGAAPASAQERIRIASDWGAVTAELHDTPAARALLRQLPLSIGMRDHLRQEKTGTLPAPLPEAARQRDFVPGTLGLWGSDHFVLYYRGGQVPAPGIVVLGRVTGDAGLFDRPGPIRIRIETLP